MLDDGGSGGLLDGGDGNDILNGNWGDFTDVVFSIASEWATSLIQSTEKLRNRDLHSGRGDVRLS